MHVYEYVCVCECVCLCVCECQRNSDFNLYKQFVMCLTVLLSCLLQSRREPGLCLSVCEYVCVSVCM